jgi:EAL and modified HD-GYP domain-containing signal transduction protein
MDSGGHMRKHNEKKTDNPDAISFIRYPVFKQQRHLWGYWVRCFDKHGDAGHRLHGEGDVSNLVSSSSCMGLEKLLTKGKGLMVDLNQTSVMKAIPYALPASYAVIRVSETMLMEAPIRSALEKLKSDGYRIAVSGFTGEQKFSDFYGIADILCLRAAGKNSEELSEIKDAAQPFKAKLMGESVRDPEHFERCSDLGFTLFQGSFFKAPERMSVRKITSIEASRFKLMKTIEARQPDFEKLADIIQSDVTISLRLLTYLNSAYFGFTTKISSIQQAITLLGWENMKKWLRVVILSDISKHPYAQDLVLLSSQRGKFLEKIVQDHDFWDFSPDSLFLLGVFSLLDALLGMPMDKVVQHLPLENKLKTALIGDLDNEYTPLLKMAVHLEEAEWEKADRMIQQLSMNNAKVKNAFHGAVEWADKLACMDT